RSFSESTCRTRRASSRGPCQPRSLRSLPTVCSRWRVGTWSRAGWGSSTRPEHDATLARHGRIATSTRADLDSVRLTSPRCLARVADDLDVVALAVLHERRVVVAPVPGARSRLAVVLPAGLHRSAIEGVDVGSLGDAQGVVGVARSL